MSIFAWCMQQGESLASLSSGPLPKKDTERGLRVVWPVQMVNELMRLMWRGRCSLDTWREYWFSIFYFFALRQIRTSSGPAKACMQNVATTLNCRYPQGLQWQHIKMMLLKSNCIFFFFVLYLVSCFRQCSYDVWTWIRPAAASQPAQYTQHGPQQQGEQEHHFSTRNHRNYEEPSGYNHTNTGVQFSVMFSDRF